MTRVAVIDCGTNSLRLLVTDIDGESQRDVDRRLEIVRLGQGVDRTGRFAPEALARTLTVVETYAALIDSLGAERVRMVATSATRDARDRSSFATRVRSVLGVGPEVISGEEEARLVCRRHQRLAAVGAHALSRRGHRRRVDRAGGRDGRRRISMQRRRRLRPALSGTSNRPATARSDRGCSDGDRGGMDEATRLVPISATGSLVGLAGSVTTVAAIHLGLTKYDPVAIHRARVPASAVREISDRLLVASHTERAAIPAMHPGRVDVIAAGALVLRSVIDRAGVDEVIASETDILDGIAWELAQPAEPVHR